MTTIHKPFLDTTEVAQQTGTCRATIARACREHKGFAIRLNGAYRIPAEHLARLLKGETAREIAAQVRAGSDIRAA